MTAHRPFVLTVVLAAAMVAPSCRLFRKTPKAAAPIPPPISAPSKPAAHKPAPKPKEVPAPPQVPPQEADLTRQFPSEPAAEKLPPRPRERRRPARGQTETAGQTPSSTQPPAQPEPPEDTTAEADVPELEQILTPQQRQAYIEEIDNNVGRAQKTVEMLQGRRLNGDQKIYLERVRAFIEQAREARKSDLFRAKNLSERASVLAEDLMRSVQ
ncbi:MAG: hypothetical protein ACM336_17035 [Acidobacteriota bacterium]